MPEITLASQSRVQFKGLEDWLAKHPDFTQNALLGLRRVEVGVIACLRQRAATV
jgi:hypothetical protein